MGLARYLFEVCDQRSGNPLTSGGRDDGKPLQSQMISGMLNTNRSDRRVADAGQHGPTLIEGALHISYALTINPRRRVQHPTVLGIRYLGDAVDTRGVFACGLGKANRLHSHIPLDQYVTAIRLPTELIHRACRATAHPTKMTMSSLVV